MLHMPRPTCFAVFLAAVLVILALGSNTAVAGSPIQPQHENGNIVESQLWQNRFHDLEQLRGDIQHSAEMLKSHEEALSQGMRTIPQDMARLLRLYRSAGNRPTGQLSMVFQMMSLRVQLRGLLAPVETVSDELAAQKSELARLQNDLTATDPALDAGGAAAVSSAEKNDEEADQANRFQKELADAAKELRNLSDRLDATLVPAQRLNDTIDENVKNIESGLIATWQRYYLNTTGALYEDVSSLPASVDSWFGSLSATVSWAFPSSLDAWVRLALSFVIGAVIMLGIGAVLHRQSGRLPNRWRIAVRQIISGAWVWLAVGVALLFSSGNSYGGLYFAPVMVGVLFIIWGMASLSWRLRRAALPSLNDKRLPLGRLFPPAAIGVICLYLEMPPRMLGILWSVVMFFFLRAVVKVRDAKSGDEKLPLLERVLYGLSILLGIISLFLGLAGYARLGILLHMLLFAISNTLTLASALMAFSAILADRTFNKTEKPLRNALAHSVFVPVSWVLSLVCTLPWQWAVPGARYIMNYALSAGYSVGGASLNMGRVLFIVLLFFLFRSLIRLGSTTLSNLPNSMPNIERGVIPPLQTLLTYALWALFVVITLGLLGVSLTSLAVVAGGLSVGIGFGMQNIFNNLVSGIMLIFGRSVLVGDYISVAGIEGTVKNISVRSTMVETPDMALVFVPNSSLMSGQFTNWTRNNSMVRMIITVGVAYGSDIEQVKKLMIQAAMSDSHVSQFPAPVVIMTGFGASSLDFNLYIIVTSFSLGGSTASRVRGEIYRLFNENGIDIPFPQMELRQVPASSS